MRSALDHNSIICCFFRWIDKIFSNDNLLSYWIRRLRKYNTSITLKKLQLPRDVTQPWRYSADKHKMLKLSFYNQGLFIERFKCTLISTTGIGKSRNIFEFLMFLFFSKFTWAMKQRITKKFTLINLIFFFEK